jgi:hypothetical protein
MGEFGLVLHPVRQVQAGNALQLPLVVGHYSGSISKGMAGDPEVVGAGGCFSRFRAVAMPSMATADLWALGQQYRLLQGKVLELLFQGDSLGAASGALEQLGPGHKRHRELISFRQRINAIRPLAGLLLDQVDKNVGVK